MIPPDPIPAILEGEVREVLGRLPDESIHCVVTSPPDLGAQGLWPSPGPLGRQPGLSARVGLPDPWQFEGRYGDPERSELRRGGLCSRRAQGPVLPLLRRVARPAWSRADGRTLRPAHRRGLRRGPAGLLIRRNAVAEPGRYVPGRQPGPPILLRGVLGSLGSLPDSWQGRPTMERRAEWKSQAQGPRGNPVAGHSRLQRRGWRLRSDCVWAKPNPMPESVRNRPTRSHEYVFLLTKSNRDFYDVDGVRQPYRPATRLRLAQATFDTRSGGPKDYGGRSNRSARRALVNLKGRMMAPQIEDAPGRYSPLGANLRSVWWIPTHGYPEAHFATFPETLAETCIRAGTTDHGACRKCGSPLRRVVEVDFKFLSKRLNPERPRSGFARPKPKGQADSISGSKATKVGGWNELPRAVRIPRTVGWKSSCSCGTGETLPSVVLDPFAGSGTTLAVARRLGRRSIGIELKPEYADLARHRTSSIPVGGPSHEAEAHA